MSTLEAAGHLIDPYTTTNLFGQPSSIWLPGAMGTLMGGVDDSALPELADPAYSRPELKQGSSTATFTKETPAEVRRSQGSAATLIFLGVLAVALYLKR